MIEITVFHEQYFFLMTMNKVLIFFNLLHLIKDQAIASNYK